MKKFLFVLIIAVVAFIGCAKKEAKEPVLSEGRRLLIEGTVFLKQGDVVKAVQSFATSIKVAPDDFEAYYLLSETLIRLKQFPQAEAILTAAVSRFPDNGVAYYLLSLAQQNQGKLLPAILSARKSVDLLTARGDQEGQQRAMILLAALVNEAKSLSEEQAIQNAAAEAGKASSAVQVAPVTVVPVVEKP